MPPGRETGLLLIALLAAILLHASAILSVLVEWPDAGRPIERLEIPVELVFDTPPKSEEQQRETPPPDERESGGDPNLAPGRPAETPSPLAEPAPPDPVAEFAPPLKKPAPPAPPIPPKPAEAPPAPPQQTMPPAQTTQAAPRQPSRLSLIGQGGGDVYLNQLHDLIEKQRSYPDIANPMRLSGVAIYELRLSRDGEIVSVILLRSTGIGPLDQEGVKIVRRSGPFPPVPVDIRSNLPGNMLGIRLDLPIHP